MHAFEKSAEMRTRGWNQSVPSFGTLLDNP